MTTLSMTQSKGTNGRAGASPALQAPPELLQRGAAALGQIVQAVTETKAGK